MDFKEERGRLNSWSKKQGKEKIKSYWVEKKTKSIDGFKQIFHKTNKPNSYLQVKAQI